MPALERCVGSVRPECLGRLLALGRRQFECVLRVDIRQFNEQRPHRGVDLPRPGSQPRSRSVAHSDALSAAGQATRPSRRSHSRIPSGGVKIELCAARAVSGPE